MSHFRVLSVVAILALLPLLTCNPHVYPVPTTFQLAQDCPLELVSAVPAAEGDDGSLEPVCSAEKEATGLLLRFVIRGTSESQIDRDSSIRPGDVVKPKGAAAGQSRPIQVEENKTVGSNSFQVTFDCIERYPDVDMGGNQGCQGLDSTGVKDQPPLSVSYKVAGDLEPWETRNLSRNLIGVAVLIDMSGSMKGFVFPGTYEDVTPTAPQTTKTSEETASDIKGLRTTAVREFLQALNDNDLSIVFQFGENLGTGGRAKVVCFDKVGKSEEDELRNRCFSTDRSLVTDAHRVGEKFYPPELDKLVNLPDKPGRSPLWQALLDVYQFMKGRDIPIRHIVVINDGPDTCDPSSPYFRPYLKQADGKPIYQGPCSTSGFAEFREALMKDLNDPGAPRIHISFIQFQAPGYLEQDPRQMEIACLSGGHYQFINSKKPVPFSPEQLEKALKNAMLRQRRALAGVWEMGIAIPPLKGSLNLGAVYSAKGTVRLLGKANVKDTLTSSDIFLQLGVGEGECGGTNAFLDRRAVFRLPCREDGDCASWFSGNPGDCERKGCLPLDRVCGFDRLEDKTQCGTNGICCSGFCLEGATDCKI